MSARLEIFVGTSREVVNLDTEPITLGRSADADVSLADQNVSRVHAKLTPVAGRWTIEDVGSKNGTWINGERRYTEQTLNNGDEIKLGSTTIVFYDSALTYESSTLKKERPPELTRKETEVILELCRPMFANRAVKRAATVKEIAEAMFTGEAAVKQHLGHLYDKFLIPEAGTGRRDLLAEAAIECGLVSPSSYESAASS